MYSVRPARPEDVDRLVAIHLAAFPDDRTGAARKRNFEQNPFGPFERLRVLERTTDREILGHAFLFRFGAFFGGKRVDTAGIASVGIAPEARGRGAGGALLRALENEAREAGDALVLLYPFRSAFYAKLGYAQVPPLVRIEASPHAIPQTWIRAAQEAALAAPTGDDAAALHDAYLRHALRTTGWLVRPERYWERLLLNERRHVFVLRAGKTVRGYVAFHHEQAEAHADITLVVDELVCDDDEARRVLFGVLGTQRDQVRALSFLTTPNDPFVWALEDPDRAFGGNELVEHPIGVMQSGPMLKVLDVEAALAARGYAESGALSLRIEGEEHVVTVASERGEARVSRGGQPNVTLGRTTLASIFFGGLRAKDAARAGAFEASRDATLALDALASLPPFEVVDPF